MNTPVSEISQAEPPQGCQQCVRLAEFRARNAEAHPDWFNAPVRSFGPENARLLIVGLAPGLQGANKTGRPFTGDYAGDLLYATLDRYGFSSGAYDKHAGDGLALQDCMITNAVRCVPPQNKPTTQEMRNCSDFLAARITLLPQLRVILALGRIAHESTLSTLGYRKSAFRFAHAATHELEQGYVLVNSYHCSRYNTNTGRLTPEMFDHVFEIVRKHLP